LIGAIALVVILVVFVPMVLDSEPRPARSPALPIPSRDNAPPLPAPAPAKAEAPPVKVESPAKADTAPAKAEAPAKTEAPPAKAEAPPAKTTTPPKAAAAQPKAEAPKLEGFAVQVGAFRDEAKLKQAREKLVAASVPHYTERLDSQGGPLTRLRAGPFPTREAAEAAQAVLKRSALDGKVVPLP
jgi:DedD protein